MVQCVREGGLCVYVLRRMLPFLRPYRWQLIAGLSALLLATPLTLFHPLVWMYITDEVAIKGKVHLLLPAIGVMIVVHLIGTVLSALHRNVLEKVGQGFVADFRALVYDKLQHQSVAFHQNHRSGDLLSRAMNDIDAMQEAIIRGIDQVLVAGLRFVIVGGLIISIHPVVGGFTMIPIVAVWFVVRVFNQRVKALYRQVRDRLGDVAAQFQEGLAGHLVVKAFAQESSLRERFRRVNRAYLQKQVRAINTRHIFLPGAQFLGFFVLGFV